MREMAISKFKATCLAVLEEVRRSGDPVLVTRFGQPVALVGPPRPVSGRRRKSGAMAGTGRILGDLVAPAADASDWDALR